MKVLVFLISIFILFHSITAKVHYHLEEFMDSTTNIGGGYVVIDEDPFFNIKFSPDVSYKGVDVGFDINAYIPLSDEKSAKGVSSFVLRHVAYDYNDMHGFKYGRIKGLTMGQGLLMDSFDTGSGGPIEFSHDKTGFYGYSTLKNVRLSGLYSAQELQAARVKVEVPKLSVMGAPVFVGGTFVEDKDGVNDSFTGARRAKQKGFAADISVPLAGEFLTLYTEYADLDGYGEGGSLGFRGNFLDQLSYRGEYRRFGSQFVPGYFDALYEATSFNLATDSPQNKVNGMLLAMSSNFFQNYVKAGAQYEFYFVKNEDNINVLTASFGWKKIKNVSGVINYRNQFTKSSDIYGTAIADLFIETGKIYDLLIRYKVVIIPSATDETSYSVGVKVNTNNIMPSMPSFLN